MANGGKTINFAQPEVVIPPAVPPSWADVIDKPTTFPPAEHANEAHNPDYLDVNTPIASSTAVPHTWVVPGDVAVPSGDANVVPPMIVTIPIGKTAKLLSVRYGITGGTSATFKLSKNGVDVTGYTGISATTTYAETDATDVTLANGDRLQPIVTAVSGSPKNLSVSIMIEYGG